MYHNDDPGIKSADGAAHGRGTATAAPPPLPDGAPASAGGERGANELDARAVAEAALRCISASFDKDWPAIAGALHAAVGADGRAMFDAFAARAPMLYDADRVRAVWAEAVDGSSVASAGAELETLVALAREVDLEAWRDECARLLGEPAASASASPTASSLIEELNKRWCVLPIGGKTRVATWGEDPTFPGRETIVMVSAFADFRSLQNKYRVNYQRQDGKIVKVPRGTWWLDHPGRRQYDHGMKFMPRCDAESANETLNLWRFRRRRAQAGGQERRGRLQVVPRSRAEDHLLGRRAAL